MAAVHQRSLYRSVLRELRKGVSTILSDMNGSCSSEQSVAPRPNRNKTILSSFRTMFEKSRDEESSESFSADMENAITFLRSQRTYKELLERYNPLVDLTAEERIEATARRVGLNMPIPKPDEER
ncbi:hypothetical protein OE88DRAFT_704475 [Heliocybe sulcata]|uniref:Uncharacterized protein n=1 Tax=Heliocybe sulcata TaxID=5364 RepID=A0A5C3NFA9_9AGAM|nr:hypothetical protein OE88DRAFT_704475 [Heliocybe sulcata]